MGHIHPRKLKQTRELRNLSQFQLAEASGISQKQISRLEATGAPSGINRCHGKTLRQLASALGVAAEDLATPPKRDEEDAAEGLGLKRVSFYLSEQDRLNYRFLEARYGVKAHDILRAAPLLFLATAEMCLAERQKALAKVQKKLGKVPEVELGHLDDIRIGFNRAEEAMRLEQQSISMRDLAGEIIAADHWSEMYDGTGDLFVDYLERKIRELAPEVIGAEDGIEGGIASLSVKLFEAVLDDLSGNHPLARLALRSGDVHPRDIPSELISEEQTAVRVKWLAERCSEESKRAQAKLMAGIDLSGLEEITDDVSSDKTC
ncbi:helix-turn-helix domain-containing protein [Roseibium album]|uniref:helix-turn-helix domain-containing protein n=1 Tax=Roseibium album TaxID=311410 RepID=UPI00249175E1|nr:helix-turn-helix transcriptional regulator [Roseibium album]